MKISYDFEFDALYIELLPLAPATAETRELSEEIIVNYSPDGKLAGLEVLDASLVFGEQLQEIIIENAAGDVLHRMAIL
jgi:uncharacterized protein YuzE